MHSLLQENDSIFGENFSSDSDEDMKYSEHIKIENDTSTTSKTTQNKRTTRIKPNSIGIKQEVDSTVASRITQPQCVKSKESEKKVVHNRKV